MRKSLLQRAWFVIDAIGGSRHGSSDTLQAWKKRQHHQRDWTRGSRSYNTSRSAGTRCLLFSSAADIIRYLDTSSNLTARTWRLRLPGSAVPSRKARLIEVIKIRGHTDQLQKVGAVYAIDLAEYWPSNFPKFYILYVARRMQGAM